MRKAHTERVLPAIVVRNGLRELFLTGLARWLWFFLNQVKRQLQLLKMSKVRHFQSPPNVSKSLPVCGYNSPVSQIVLHCDTLVEANPFLVPQNKFVTNPERMNVLFAQSCPTPCDPWTGARQAPLPMGFSRQECWSGLPFPPPGNLPDPGIERASPVSAAWAGAFFTTKPFGKPTPYQSPLKPNSCILASWGWKIFKVFLNTSPQPLLLTIASIKQRREGSV